MVNEPCASLVLTNNTATRPAAKSAETSRTKGARAAELRGRTTRNGGLPAERAGGRGAVAGRVGGLTGCALTPPP